jgi:hypothetical protein
VSRDGPLAFGQREGGVVQCAYTTADIEQGMKDFTARLGVGPWFVTGPFVPPQGIYRGKPTQMRLTLAIGFAGHMMIELIEQHDDLPSVYREFVERRGHGFHHWAITARDFDAEVARHQALGYAVAFSDRSPRGVRIVYMDTTADLPGMLEIIEMTDALEQRYLDMYRASLDFDGSEPIKRD